MADNFRVIFVGLAEGADSQAVTNALTEKLKTSPEKVAAFRERSAAVPTENVSKP